MWKSNFCPLSTLSSFIILFLVLVVSGCGAHESSLVDRLHGIWEVDAESLLKGIPEEERARVIPMMDRFGSMTFAFDTVNMTLSLHMMGDDDVINIEIVSTEGNEIAVRNVPVKGEGDTITIRFLDDNKLVFIDERENPNSQKMPKLMLTRKGGLRMNSEVTVTVWELVVIVMITPLVIAFFWRGIGCVFLMPIFLGSEGKGGCLFLFGWAVFYFGVGIGIVMALRYYIF